MAATSSATTMVATDGGAWPISLMATTVPTSPIITSIEDTASQRFEGSGSLAGRINQVATSASATTGTFTRNTEPHQKDSSSVPPRIGPRADPTTDRLPQIAIAKFRSRSTVKYVRISARVAGIIAAAPTASTARAPISTSGDGANAASRDANPKITRPTTNIRVWPMRSPRVPLPSSRPAITRG